MTSCGPTPVRITGPADLLQAVPYLLGFRPAASLVLVGLASGRLLVTARMDLSDLAEPDVLPHTLRAMVRGGTERIVAAIFDDTAGAPFGRDGLPWRGLGDELRGVCAAAGTGTRLDDLLLVCGGRWWSLVCEEPACCPREGRLLPTVPSPFVAAATYEGIVALPSRAALADTLTPLPDAEREALRPLLRTAERQVPAEAAEAERRRYIRLRRRELLEAARAAGRNAPALSDADVVRLGVALRATPVRDAVWTAGDASRVDGRELWRELARRLPAPYDAAPAFLFGWASWRAGEGALAQVACERAIASDPRYSAADLLQAALSQAVDPRRVPPMRRALSDVPR